MISVISDAVGSVPSVDVDVVGRVATSAVTGAGWPTLSAVTSVCVVLPSACKLRKKSGTPREHARTDAAYAQCLQNRSVRLVHPASGYMSSEVGQAKEPSAGVRISWAA